MKLNASRAASPARIRNRNASLDGVRGLAVILVILYHHGLLNSGWMGVDFFFVLSGYLITTIIWRTRDDTFFWREFWIKRATRILPPLLVALLLTALLLRGVSPLQASAYFLSFGDVLAYLRPNFEPLRPLWSLAVEEHFYIFWPFAVRFLPYRSLVWLLSGVIVAGPIARSLAIMAVHDWQFVYFLTPFRLDGLAFGCILALLFLNERFRAVLQQYSSLGIAFTVVSWLLFRFSLKSGFTRDNPTVAYSAMAYFLIAMLAFFSIAHLLTHPQSIYARLLAYRPLAYLGTISYGVYLYHVILREVLTRNFGLSIRGALALDFPIVLVVSWLSFEYYEKPIITWGKVTSERLRGLKRTKV